jgi:hypothetical protein
MVAPRRVAQLVGSLALLALLAYQSHALFVQEHGVPHNPPRARRVRVGVGGATTAAQVFRVDALGFSALTLFFDGAQTTAASPDGEVVIRVWELAPWYPREPDDRRLVVRQSMLAAEVRAVSSAEIGFPREKQSRGRYYRVEVSMPSAPDGAGIGLVANTEGGQPYGELWIGDREQWADLAFTTRVAESTAAASARAALAPYLPDGWAPAAVIALVVGLDLVLFVVGAGLLRQTGDDDRRDLVASAPHVAWLLPPVSWPTLLVVIAASAVGGLLLRGTTRFDDAERDAIPLLDRFPEAEKRTTYGSLQQAFDVQDVTIDGVQRPSLLALPFSRVTWTVDVPPQAVLRAAVAFRPDAWRQEGDGALFRIGVSDGARYEEVYRRYVAPYASAGDRRWYNVEADLSSFAGSRVSLIFNTEPGELGNAVADATVWGAPRVVPHASRRTAPASK